MSHLDTTVVRIRDWLHGHFPLARHRQVGFDESLLDSGIIDSLGTLDVVLFLEKELGVEVSDEEMVADHFESIQSIANFVESKVSPQANQIETD
jgi:acyl carrier protein